MLGVEGEGGLGGGLLLGVAHVEKVVDVVGRLNFWLGLWLSRELRLRHLIEPRKGLFLWRSLHLSRLSLSRLESEVKLSRLLRFKPSILIWLLKVKLETVFHFRSIDIRRRSL